MLSVPEKHVTILLNSVKAIGADAGRQEEGMGLTLDALRSKIASTKPNVARNRLIEIGAMDRLGLMLAVDHVAEHSTASTKHWAERARRKLVETDPASTARVTL